MILLEFMEVYHVFPRMPGDNYGRQLMSLLLCPLLHV